MYLGVPEELTTEEDVGLCFGLHYNGNIFPCNNVILNHF